MGISDGYRCDVCRRRKNRCTGCRARRQEQKVKLQEQKRLAKICIDCATRAKTGLIRCAQDAEANNRRSRKSHARAAAKQRSRDADAIALASGAKTRKQLRLENSLFRELAHEPIQWSKTKVT